jgi:hypothetical protein
MPDPNLMTMARWLATKAIKAQLRARRERIEARELHLLANNYFEQHKTELIEVARDHPALLKPSVRIPVKFRTLPHPQSR